jgi:hypothetical protein
MGGVSAPPISRVLGQGACFVLRELVRRDLVDNAHAHRHCFVPSLAVRKVLGRLGFRDPAGTQPWDRSAAIHAFLSEHLQPGQVCFRNDFDIPFQVLSMNKGLADRFLQGEADPGSPPT